MQKKAQSIITANTDLRVKHMDGKFKIVRFNYARNLAVIFIVFTDYSSADNFLSPIAEDYIFLEAPFLQEINNLELTLSNNYYKNSDFEVSVELEYGVNEYLTAFLEQLYVIKEDGTNGRSDLELGIKFLLYTT